MLDWSGDAEGPDVGCRFCLYWERPDCSQWPDSLAERGALKREWFRRVGAEFGSCGKLAFVGPRAVGYAQFGPARHLPGAGEYACGPPVEDAVFISCLYIRDRDDRRKGIGSALLEAILHELCARGERAVETIARKNSADNPSGPLRFWLKHGFAVIREDDEFALVHRDL